MPIAFVPLDPPTEIDVDSLGPWVRELVDWQTPESCPPTLVGLIRSAPRKLLGDVRRELGGCRATRVPWTLDAIVTHALVPLAELSLVDGQPVIPELGATLVSLLADPRLGNMARAAVELVLLDSEELEGVLEAEAHGSPDG